MAGDGARGLGGCGGHAQSRLGGVQREGLYRGRRDAAYSAAGRVRNSPIVVEPTSVVAKAWDHIERMSSVNSSLLWKIDEFLQSKKLHPINDIWVLYKKD